MTTQFKDKGEEPEKDLFFFDTIGFSMWPFLRGGEKLVIKKAAIKDLVTGDIILYQSDNKIVCHRLIEKIRDKQDRRFYARGDSSYSLPELVKEEMLLGKAIGIIKNGKMINLCSGRQKLINYFIVIIAPFTSRMLRALKILIKRDEKHIFD